MSEGTGSPRSLLLCDVVDWLSSLTADHGLHVGSSLDVDLVQIGRAASFCSGRQHGETVKDGLLYVKTDGHGSLIRVPFTGAPLERCCQAYEALLRSLLHATFDLASCLGNFSEFTTDCMHGAVLLDPWERLLLNSVAADHGVRVVTSPSRPAWLRAWVVHYASLVVHGQRLRLPAHSSRYGNANAPWLCSAELLAGAVLFLAYTRSAEFVQAAASSSTQVLPCQGIFGAPLPSHSSVCPLRVWVLLFLHTHSHSS